MAINLIQSVSEEERKAEGVVEAEAILSLDLSDSDLVSFLDFQMKESEAYWREKPRDLEEARKRNEKYWLGTYQEDLDFHGWEFPYNDNRIFMSVETIIPNALAKPPEPAVSPAADTDASRQLAEDVKKILLAKYQELKLRGKFRMAVRHLILYRLGCLKYRWDKDIGKWGDVAVEWVRPQKLIIDKNAVVGENPGFVAEYMEDTIEDLGEKFPDKKAALWSKYGIVKGTKKQLSKKIGYYEVWFTYGGGEAVCWKCEELILGKMKNPHWDYQGIEGIFNNHFENPRKPYIFLSYLNLGKSFIDDIALVEVAIPLQKTLDKRGEQIVENADAANSGLVFDKNFISKTEAAKLSGAFDEKVVGDGDVRSGVARLAPPLLPNYVMEDKYDARNEIDNLLGTHSTLRGERGKQETLGGRMLLREGDVSRIGDLVQSAIEPAAEELYNGLVQLFKVFYVRERFVKHAGKEGDVSFLQFNRDKIEDGVGITVRTGTTLPTDKMAQRAEALDLAKANLIDPMTLFEKLDHSNPREEARRLILYTIDPKAYMTEVLGEKEGKDFAQEAIRNIQLISEGEYVDPPQDVSEEYLTAYTNFVGSAAFKELGPEIQGMHIQHLEEAKRIAQRAMHEGGGMNAG